MKSTADIVLINPGDRKAIFQGLSDEFVSVEPPVFCGLFATYLRKKGCSVLIYDSVALNSTAAETARAVASQGPALAVLVVYGAQPSASTQNMTAAARIATEIKRLNPEIATMMTGTHPAALPVNVMQNELAVDLVCSGEGPPTIFRTLQALKNGSPKNYEFSGIPSLWFRAPAYGGFIAKNICGTSLKEPLLDDLDGEMPGIAWDLLPAPSTYRSHNWHSFGHLGKRSPYAAIHTSLGCPYKCHFCCINAPFGKSSYRMWSPRVVVDEIYRLADEYGVMNLKFVDEMFVLNRRHVMDICALLKRRDFPLNIWAYARVDTVEDEYLDAMKAAGINWLCLGIESASKHVRDGALKKYGNQDIIDVVRKIQGAGINVIGNFIFGLPDDTQERMQETLDLSLELKCEYTNFYCLPAGTPIYTPTGIKNIEEVQTGDDVLSLNGRTTVKMSMLRFYSGNLYLIKPRYLPPIEVTDEHPILIRSLHRTRDNEVVFGEQRWVKPENIASYSDHWATCDAVIIPKDCFVGQETFVDFSPFVHGHIGNGKRGGQLGPIGGRYLKPWPLTEDLAELFGWYVAEGSRLSRKNNQIGFSLGVKKDVARVRKLVMECFGFKTRVKAVENVRVISLTSKVLIRALPELFGETSQTKQIPPFIMESQPNIARAFLKGYIAGDGTAKPNENGQMAVSTSSKTLAYQLVQLFLKIGIVPGWLYTGPIVRQSGLVKRTGPHYKLSWTIGGGSKHYFEDSGAFYIPIKDVVTRPFNGTVYNIETADNTYAVPFIVHNCAMAYPGSPLYTQAVKDKRQLPEKWEDYSQHGYGTLPLANEFCTSAEILAHRDMAFQTYFTDPGYLDHVRRKFGQAEVDHIGRMVKIPLKRKILGD